MKESYKNVLFTRAEHQCELTKFDENLVLLNLSLEGDNDNMDNWLVISQHCLDNLDNPMELGANAWRSLSETMWSPVPAVQIASYRVLKRLSQAGEAWATELIDSMYLDEEMQAWANAGLDDSNTAQTDHQPKDSNDVILNAGDNITLIKDLTVKGANFTAKRGTPVKNISLSDDPKHIEGKINGQRIVIVAEYTKKN